MKVDAICVLRNGAGVRREGWSDGARANVQDEQTVLQRVLRLSSVDGGRGSRAHGRG
jgi:hypothetical protein